jgi:Uma2 family endonuclease
MATITRRAATEEDLLNTPDDGIYELVDGEIRLSPGGGRHGKASMALVILLGSYVKERRLGHVLGPDTGHRLPGGNVRCPDVSFIASGRFPNEEISDDFVNFAPDLAVEVISPSDRSRWILDKVGEYLDAGVRMVWVIDPRTSSAAVHRSLVDVREIGIDDFLEGGEVVPGFRCRLREIL